MEDLIGVLMEVVGELNEQSNSDFGPLSGIDIKVKLNEVEESGIGLKGQVLLAGPTLNQINNKGSSLFPNKSDDDLFIILSIRTKGDAQVAVDELQGLITDFGIPLEALGPFGELKFQAGDGEILIGFKAEDNPYTDMAKNYLLKPSVFGDGSEDITGDLSFNLGTSFNDMLDEEALFTHLIKSLSFEIKGQVHEKTRQNILSVLESKKEQLGPILGAVYGLFMVKNVRSTLEIDTTEEMKEKLVGSAREVNPMAAMTLKEIFAFVKAAGMPLEMAQPVLEFISTKTAGEISISGVAQVGFKLTVRLPGLDEAVSTFLADS